MVMAESVVPAQILPGVFLKILHLHVQRLSVVRFHAGGTGIAGIPLKSYTLCELTATR